jgi:3-dehydrosphinganine reductase
VTSPTENARIIKEATAWNNGNPPDIIWANAGAAHPSLFAETSIDTLRSQMDIDYWAAAYLAHETINLWANEDTTLSKPDTSKAVTRPHPRHFIITSSVIAFVGLAGYAPYAPAKAALRSLADSLRSELALYNGANAAHPERPLLKNHIVFPAGITSPGFDTENETKHPVTFMLEEDDKPQTEDEVAAAAFAGLEKGDFQITTNLLGYLMRTSTMGGSSRNGLGVLDTVTSWLGSIIWLFVGPDMEKKVFSFGKKNGVNGTKLT